MFLGLQEPHCKWLQVDPATSEHCMRPGEMQFLLPGWLCDQMHSATCRTLFNEESGLCLDAGTITQNCSNAVVLWNCTNTASQRWTAYDDRSVRPDSNTSVCLDVAGNLYTQQQAAIHTWCACTAGCRSCVGCLANPLNLMLLVLPHCMGMHMRCTRRVPSRHGRLAMYGIWQHRAFQDWLHVPGCGRMPEHADAGAGPVGVVSSHPMQ